MRVAGPAVLLDLDHHTFLPSRPGGVGVFGKYVSYAVPASKA